MMTFQSIKKSTIGANVCIFKRNEKKIQETFYIETQDNFRWFVSIGKWKWGSLG